jgi:UDP-N-acetylmuramate--alanine ligase
MSDTLKEIKEFLENPELKEAKRRGIKCITYPQALNEISKEKYTIAVSGTHGKTTTTSMVGQMLETAGFDPTVINGGIVNAYGTNTRIGKSAWMVVEADESDGTFTHLPEHVAVVTNIDPEHLDHYGDFEAIKNAFVEFVENVPFYGAAIMCLDHPEVQAILPKIRDRRIITYGFSAQSDIRGENVTPHPGGNSFDVVVRARDGSQRTIEGIRLPMPGRHNVQNALAAVAVGLVMGMRDEAVAQGFVKFGGV